MITFTGTLFDNVVWTKPLKTQSWDFHNCLATNYYLNFNSKKRILNSGVKAKNYHFGMYRPGFDQNENFAG